jgi:hypothetical protein
MTFTEWIAEIEPAARLEDAHGLGQSLRALHRELRTPRQRVWNDFEDTFRGPVHWDLAS